MNLLQRIGLGIRVAFGTHARQIPLGTLLSMGGDSGGAQRAWKYPQYSKDGYRGNSVVFGCIKQKAQACQGIPLCLALNGEEYSEETPLPENLKPLEKLLSRPNPNQSMDEFVARWVLHMDLGGSAPLHAIGTGTQRIGQQTFIKSKPELWLKRPDLVTVETNKDGTLKGYLYQPEQGGKAVPITTDEMMVWRYPHPDNEYAGLSPLAAVEEVIDAHSASTTWNRNLLKNSGTPSGVLLLKNQSIISQVELDRLKEFWQHEYAGAVNNGKTFVAPAEGMDYTRLGGSASDLDWLGGRGDMKREICSALGVPSKLLNDPEAGTYANYAEARKAFYTETILPLMNYFVSELNEWLVPKYGIEGLHIVLKTDHIDALREDESAKYNRMSTPAAQSTMSINEIRAELGLGEIEGGDELLQQQPAFDFGLGQASYRKTPKRGANYQQTTTAQKTIARYMGALRGPMRKFAADVVSKLESGGAIDKYIEYIAEQHGERTVPRENRDAEADKAKLAKLAGPLIKSMSVDLDPIAAKYTKQIWGDGSTHAFGQLGANLTWNLDSPHVDKIVKARQNMMKDVTDAQKDSILDSVRTTIYEQGANPLTPALLKDIKELAVNKADYEVERIARTESLVVAGTAQQTVFKENGVARKGWQYSGSGYPRHEGMDGEEVDIDEPFSNGLMYPGDPDGEPEEIIHCGCAHYPVGTVDIDDYVTE